MHGSSDKQPREGQSVYRNWRITFYALPVLVVVALIGFAISHPSASRWISEAVEAEFANSDIVQEITPPTRLAQPRNQSPAIRAY